MDPDHVVHQDREFRRKEAWETRWRDNVHGRSVAVLRSVPPTRPACPRARSKHQQLREGPRVFVARQAQCTPKPKRASPDFSEGLEDVCPHVQSEVTRTEDGKIVLFCSRRVSRCTEPFPPPPPATPPIEKNTTVVYQLGTIMLGSLRGPGGFHPKEGDSNILKLRGCPSNILGNDIATSRKLLFATSGPVRFRFAETTLYWAASLYASQKFLGAPQCNPENGCSFFLKVVPLKQSQP